MKEKKCQNKDDQVDKKKGNDKSITEKKEDHEKNAGNDKTENNIKDDVDEAFEKTCKFCFKMFIHSKSCRKHMAQKHGYSHSGGTKEICKQKVQRSVVQNSTENKCSFCGKVYLHSFTLNRHMQKHEDPNIFKCKFCDKSFSRKDMNKLCTVPIKLTLRQQGKILQNRKH